MERGSGACLMPPRIASSRRPSQPLRLKEWRFMKKGSVNGAGANKADTYREMGALLSRVKGLRTKVPRLAAAPLEMQGAQARRAASLPFH